LAQKARGYWEKTTSWPVCGGGIYRGVIVSKFVVEKKRKENDEKKGKWSPNADGDPHARTPNSGRQELGGGKRPQV